MSVSRRRFLKHGAIAAIACAAIPGEAFNRRKQIDGDGSVDLGQNPLAHRSLSVNRGAFEGLIGSPFKVMPKSGNGSPVWLRLTAVQDPPAVEPVNVGQMSVAPPAHSSAPTTSGYILSFSAGGTSLSQDTYIFENAQMGKFPMFIVPAGPGQYTAVFNLLNAPVPLTPADDHPAPVFGGGPSSGAPSRANNAGATSGGVQAPAGNSGTSFGGARTSSPVGRPAQEQLEPMLGDRVKIEMPE
jgi:hypothetical protein